MDQTLLTSFVGYFGAGGVLLIFVLATGKSVLGWRSERNNQAPAEIANSQLQAFRAIADEANRRSDTFAAERNDLLVKVTRVESELQHLKGVTELNERLKVALDEKEGEFKQLIASHAESTRLMLDMLRVKDELTTSQAERISALEASVKDLREGVGLRCHVGNCPYKLPTI